jgi:hypothetical protein
MNSDISFRFHSIYYYFVAEHTLKGHIHVWIEFTQIPLIIFMEVWIQTVLYTDIELCIAHNVLMNINNNYCVCWETLNEWFTVIDLHLIK